MKTERKNRLSNINWDFGTRLVVDDEEVFPFNNRKFHSYPGTFIPEIPFTLIEILSERGDVVMDPFGGIGTTFIQALIQQRVPISIDNNSIATKITNDFFTLFNPQVDIDEVHQKLEEIILRFDDSREYRLSLVGMSALYVDWYENRTLNQIAFLIEEYDAIKESKTIYGLEELFHLCLSNLLTTTCSQNGGWAYIADNVKPKASALKDKKAIERFRLNVSLCVKSIKGYKRKLGDSISDFYRDDSLANVLCADFSSVDIGNLRNRVDLVITSPPYPRMIDYVKSQRLSFYLENRDFSGELSTEIGARARRNKPDTVSRYVEAMRSCNEKIITTLKRNGYLCYVLPDFSSEVKTDRREAIEEIIQDCVNRGMEIVFRTERSIPGTQRSNNIKWASLKQEQIFVLEKK